MKRKYESLRTHASIAAQQQRRRDLAVVAWFIIVAAAAYLAAHLAYAAVRS